MKQLNFELVDRVVLISDVHYGVKSGGDNTMNYITWMNTIDNYFDDFFIPLVEDIKTEHKPVVVVCGDFFDNRISIRLDIIDRAFSLIKKLSSVVEVVFMVGNHDSYHSDDSFVNSLKIFTGINGVYIVDEPTTMHIKTMDIDILPWTSDKSELGKMVRESKSTVALLHTDINGLSYPSNIQITNGVDLTDIDIIKVYSGHIHKRQETKKVTYIGSPYELDKSDTGNSKGVYVIGMNDGVFFEEFYENMMSPRHITYTYDEFSKVSRLMPDEIRNNYIEITYTKEHKADIAKIMNDIDKYECARMNFVFIDDSVVVTELSDEQKSTNICLTLEEYINSLTDISDECREFLLTKNKEYIDRANENN